MSDVCRCGHAPHQHDPEAVPPLCMVCGDNTHCDYADDEEIAADRWDEGWHAAVIALCPARLREAERLLWVLANMPKDNPYRPEQGSPTTTSGPSYPAGHGWTPSTSPFSNGEACRVMLARYVCNYSREQHDPGLPPVDVDAFGYRRGRIGGDT